MANRKHKSNHNHVKAIKNKYVQACFDLKSPNTIVYSLYKQVIVLSF